MRRFIQFPAVAVAVLIPAAAMTYKILSAPGVDCEVCVEFHGRSKCRTAHGPTEEECRRTAADNACAFLSSGMADSLACERSEKQTFRLIGRR